MSRIPFIHPRFIIRLPDEARATITSEIEDGSSPVVRYWVMIFLSTTIAAYGLLSNSAAVIIGAMLVAPLMGPIFGIALGLVSGNNLLLRNALIAEVFGVLLAVGIGFAVGKLPLNLGVSPEMLSRTAPTLYDLVIALASGFAGAYASVNVKISNALPGVSISVALVPPLATCGLFLARGDYALGGGAFLLFLANLFAIQLAASGTFMLHDLGGMSEIRKLGLARFVFRFAPSLVVTIAMGVFLTQTLVRIYADRTLGEQIEAVLSREISLRTGGSLEQILERGEKGKVYEIVAVALTPQPFEPTQVASIEDILDAVCDRPVHLVIRSLTSSDSDREGQVFRSVRDRELTERVQEEQRLLGVARTTLREGLASVQGANLDALTRTETSGEATFTAVVRSPSAIAPDLVKVLQTQLTERLGRTARLIVRSVLTRDADAQRFIFDPEPQTAPRLEPAEIALRARIQDVVTRRIRAIEGASVLETTIVQTRLFRQIDVSVEAPRPITPADVAPIQADLRRYVDPLLTLRVRSRVGGTASAGGWLGAAPGTS